MKEKVVVGWSGGKDSAFALYMIQQNQNYEVQTLLTIMTHDYDKLTTVCGVLLEQQADALGLPLQNCSSEKAP